MFPETKGLTDVSSVNAVAVGKSFLFDFATGDFVVQNGRLVECNGTESIKMWIEKVLRTEKGRFKIYDDTEYGCRLEDLLIGNNYPVSFIESELKREIEEALLQNPQISAVSNFTLERGVNSITVRMEVEMGDSGTDTVTVTL